MRKPARIVLAFAAALLAANSVPVHARSYEFERIDTQVQVAPDGTMRVIEDRTVRFDGTFRGMYRDIPLDAPLARYGGYKVILERVLDGGTRLPEVPRAQLRPGTFTSYRNGDALRLEWQYAASDETRTFRLVYRIAGHVKRYRDIAELWWTFVEGDRGAYVAYASVTVRFPEPADPRAWGHGTLAGEVMIVDARTVRFEVPGLDIGEELGARIAFSKDVVPGAPFRDETRLRTILLEERAAADSANAARNRVRLWNIIPLLAAIGWLLWWLQLFGRYGREHRSEVPEYLRELPADYPPAIVGWLMRWGDVKPEDMTATMMDLARRGFLTIRETTREKGLLFKKDVPDVLMEPTATTTQHLLPYERRVLQLLGKVRDERGKVTSNELREWAEAKPERMQEEFASFESEVRSHGRTLDMIEDRTQTMAVALVGIATLGAICWLAFSRVVEGGRDPLSSGPLVVLASGIGIGTLVMTPLLRQRSRVGAEHKARWEAFRRYLVDFGRLHEKTPGALVLWEAYLVYAIPLGVATEVIEQMRVHIPPDQLSSGGAFGWYLPIGGHGWASMETFSNSMTTLHESIGVSATAAFSTAPSGSGGGGGGFSGGGGGGGGGGSSGAY